MTTKQKLQVIDHMIYRIDNRLDEYLCTAYMSFRLKWRINRLSRHKMEKEFPELYCEIMQAGKTWHGSFYCSMAGSAFPFGHEGRLQRLVVLNRIKQNLLKK